MITAMLCVAGALSAAAAPTSLPFSDRGWETRGDASVESVDGRAALRVGTGWGYRRDVALADGTIDFEVQLTSRRSFVYLMFRMENDREYEEVYLRPHKSGLPDALQYAPVYQGHSAWQLHHGPGATAPVAFQPGAWTPVRLVVRGERAALFVGNLEAPALVMPRLRRAPRAGYLAVRGFAPAGVEGPIARFANVVARPGVFPVDPSALPADAPAPEAGAVRAWAVSGVIPAPPAEGAPVAPGDAPGGGYRRVEADERGLVELHRVVPLPKDAREATVAARVVVRAATAGTRVFDLGFSDRAIVFLDGAPLFRGEGSYSFDRPRREGLIGYDQARLYLPLRAGDNELLVVVTDGFGGMGLMGRFVGGEDLVLDAR